MKNKTRKKIIFGILGAAVIGFLVLLFLKMTEDYKQYQPKKEEPQELEEDWGKIHPDFRDNPGLVNGWKRNGLDYIMCLGFDALGIKPWESEFAFWLVTYKEWEKNTSPEEVANALFNKMLRLREEWKGILIKDALTIEKIDSIKYFLKKDIFTGEKNCAKVLQFTKLKEYEEFLQGKEPNWEYYQVWDAYLKKWRELEQKNN